MRISDWSSDVCSSDLQPDRGGGDGEQPEAGRRHRRIPAADRADDTIGREEGEIIDAADRRVEQRGGKAAEQREADRQDVREADAVEEMEEDRTHQTDLPITLAQNDGETGQ